jgi:diguanylate cyclase (GGDEF)-like protein/PAS domain S-box-containing protein
MSPGEEPVLPEARGGVPPADLVGALPGVIWEADGVTQRMTYVSPRALDLLGHDPASWVETPMFWEDHVHPEDLPAALRAAEEALAAAEGSVVPPVRVQYRFQAADGTWRQIQDAMQAVADADGGTRLVGVMVEVMPDTRGRDPDAVEGTRHAADGTPPAALPSPMHKAMMDGLTDGVFYVDAERRISYWNRAAESLTGYRAGETVGRLCSQNVLCRPDASGTSPCETACMLTAVLASGRPKDAILSMRQANGTSRAVHLRLAPIREDASGQVVGAVGSFSDATALVEATTAAEAARRDALSDLLTGLPNRRLLDLALASRKDDLDRHRMPFGLLLFDIDGLARINFDFGHEAGDEVLKVVAAAVAKVVRGGDTLVRWGGGQFAIVAAQVDADGICRLAERVLRTVRTTRVHTRSQGVPVRVSIGGGIAHPAEPTDWLLVRTEHALRAAKSTGRDRFILNDPAPVSREARTLGVTRG